MKKFLLGIITGLLISSGVVLAANYIYKADEISYTPNNNEWNVDNVDDALKDLYNKVNNQDIVETNLLNNDLTFTKTDSSSTQSGRESSVNFTKSSNIFIRGGGNAYSGVSITTTVTSGKINVSNGKYIKLAFDTKNNYETANVASTTLNIYVYGSDNKELFNFTYSSSSLTNTHFERLLSTENYDEIYIVVKVNGYHPGHTGFSWRTVDINTLELYEKLI